MARFHLVYDLASGKQQQVPFTAEEEATRDAEEAAATITAQAQVVDATERTTATADLRDQSAADLARLDEIAKQAAGFDAKQANQALADQAAMLGRVLRLLTAQGG